MFPVVRCGFGTWFLTLRQQSRLEVFENRALERIHEKDKTEEAV
jgi:hypothetical protein